MVQFRPEGNKVRQGVNVYPLNEWNYSRGFLIRVLNRILQVRYSVKLNRWFIGWRTA